MRTKRFMVGAGVGVFAVALPGLRTPFPSRLEFDVNKPVRLFRRRPPRSSGGNPHIWGLPRREGTTRGATAALAV